MTAAVKAATLRQRQALGSGCNDGAVNHCRGLYAPGSVGAAASVRQLHPVAAQVLGFVQGGIGSAQQSG